MALRLVFMGTPTFAVPVLEAVFEAGHEIAAVYSQPPRPAGRRGLETVKSPIQIAAEARKLSVFCPVNFKSDDDRGIFGAHEADAAVVVAYGLILPTTILAAPRLGCFNLHASALPRWRGAAPIQRAIMAGDTETAVAVMRMEQGLDTGPVCRTERIAIGGDETSGSLHDRLSVRGARLMVEALASMEAGALACVPQSSAGVTYAAKIEKAEARLDFSKPAHELHNVVRGLSPAPGAWFEIPGRTGLERIKALRTRPAEGRGKPGELLGPGLVIACRGGALNILEVQRAGKRPVQADEFLRGANLRPGMILNEPAPP